MNIKITIEQNVSSPDKLRRTLFLIVDLLAKQAVYHDKPANDNVAPSGKDE